MEYPFKSIPHVAAIVIATGLLWIGHGFERLSRLPEADGGSWYDGIHGKYPWVALALALAIAVAISRLQDLKRDRSLARSLEWPMLIWLVSAAPFFYKAPGGANGSVLVPLFLRLVALLGAGLVLFLGKAITRRNSGNPDLITKSPHIV